VENFQPVLRMLVVAGRPDHSTPIFSDLIEYVFFKRS